MQHHRDLGPAFNKLPPELIEMIVLSCLDDEVISPHIQGVDLLLSQLLVCMSEQTGVNEYVPLYHYHAYDKDDEIKKHPTLSLSLTCWGFYEEATKTQVFYKHTKFHFFCTRDAARYIASIIPVRRSHLANLSLWWNTSSTPMKDFQVIALCTSLKKLQVNIDGMAHHFVKQDVNTRDYYVNFNSGYGGMKHFLKIRAEQVEITYTRNFDLDKLNKINDKYDEMFCHGPVSVYNLPHSVNH
jgi:hypothetical protein